MAKGNSAASQAVDILNQIKDLREEFKEVVSKGAEAENCSPAAFKALVTALAADKRKEKQELLEETMRLFESYQ